jgi:hypothetical protein
LKSIQEPALAFTLVSVFPLAAKVHVLVLVTSFTCRDPLSENECAPHAGAGFTNSRSMWEALNPALATPKTGLPDGLFYTNLGTFWRALEWTMLQILRPFGIFYGHWE